MKKQLLYLLLFLFTGYSQSYSQSVNNYAFTTGSSSSLARSDGSLVDDIDMTVGTTVLIGGSNNAVYSTAANIGFDFYVNGTRQTQFNATSNGWVGLPTSYYYNYYGFLAYTGIRLAPFLASSNTSMGTGLYGRVHYKLIGTAPSRVLVVEFLNMVINSSTLNDTTTFQCRLYEQNGQIEYVYGPMKVSYGAPVSFNVGFQFTTTAYQSVNINTHTSSSSSLSSATFSSNGIISQLNSFVNGSRRNYKWVPTPPNDPVLSITGITGGSQTLNWTASSNATGYALYQSLDGGATYTFINTYPSTTLLSVQTGLPSNTDIFWRLYAIKESNGNNIDADAFTLNATKITSISSGNWNDPTIWTGGLVPTSSDSVLISTGNTVQINVTSAVCGTLEVVGTLAYSSVSQGILTVSGDVNVYGSGTFNAGASALTTHVLNIGGNTNTANLAGNLIVDGVFDMATSASVTTNFYGSLNSTISGSGATCDFFQLVVNKGTTINSILEVTRVITTPAANATTTNRTVLTNGTFKLSSASNITPFYGAAYLTFAATTRYWINHSGAVVNTTANATGYLYFNGGELRMDAGTATLGSGGYPMFMYGTFTLNGGSMTILGGIYAYTNTITASVNINGGNLYIDPQGTGNLAISYSSFYIAATANLNWTAGNVTILNPHSVTGGTAINILAGSAKSITGGNMIIGDGVSNKSGGAFSNTSGFAIASAVDFYNLIINNNISASNSRMARLTSDIRVTNQLTINSNSYLFLGSANSGFTLRPLATFVNNGVLAGTEPGGTQRLGSLSLEGVSGTQTISGSGSMSNIGLLSVNHTGSGVTFSNSVGWNFQRVNLIQGTVNPGSNFIIGSATFAPSVQIGGIDEFTPSGTFTSIPTFNVTFGKPSYFYGPTSSTVTTGVFNEMPAGAQNLDTLSISDIGGLSSNRAITINKLLKLSGGNLLMGTNDITIGTSILNTGSINWTSGLVSMGGGTFKRWYATGSIPATGYTYGFPILAGNNERTVQVASTGALTTGGSISVMMNDVAGFSTISPSLTDGSATVNRRTNSNWIITNTGVNLGVNTLSLSLTGQGIGAVTNVAGLTMTKSNSLETGTFLSGTGTNSIPVANRSFIQAQLFTSDTLFIGSDSTVNPLSPMYTAITNGNWSDPTTWDAGAVPTTSNDVLIPSPYTVSLTSGTSNCKNLNITSGGTLTANTGTLNVIANTNVTGTLSEGGATININGGVGSGLSIITGGVVAVSSGNINIGPTGGGNQTLNVAGALNISGGNTTINGNFNVASGSSFTQTGGFLTVDGNSGTAATSVPQGTHICNFATNTMNCSGGTILIVDPPHSSYATSTTNALRITAGASTSAFSGTHTIQFGDGVSTTIGNNNGFSIDTKRSGVVPIQNVYVNAGSQTGRWVSSSYSAGSFGTHMKGSLTIASGSEFRHTTATQLAIGGSISNNGTFTAAQAFTIGGIGYVVTSQDTISGSGTFRNSTTVSTGAFTTLTLDNNSSLTLNTSGVTFIPTVALTIGANNIVTNSNILKIPSTGTFTRTSGYVIGALSRSIAVGASVSRTFDIGVASGYLPVTLTFPTVTTAGDVTVSSTSSNHLQISSSCINSLKTIAKYWTLTNSGVAPTSYNISLNYLASDPASGINLSNINSQVYSGSVWNGNIAATANSTSATINGLTNFGDLQLGEFGSYPVSVSISPSASPICIGTSVTFTATPTNGGPAPTYQWKKNGTNVGTNSNTYTDNALANSDQVTCSMVSNSLCALSPNANSNTVTMTVNALSVGGSVNGGSNVCSGSTSGTLTLSGNTGNVVRWESSVSPFTTWTTISNTSTTYTSGALTQTTQFRAVVQNGLCTPVNAGSTTVTIDPTSVGGSVSGGSTICSGTTSGTLTLTGNTGSVIRWESSVSPFTTWNTIANTSSTYTSGALTQTTQFRAVVQSGSCSSANSSTTTVTVTSGSVGGSVSGGTSVCSGSTSGTLTLSGQTGSVVSWLSSVAPFSTWNVIASTSTTYTSGVLTQTTRFRALVQNGTCATDTSTATTVTVTTGSVGGSVNGGSNVCSGSTSPLLTLSGNTGSIVRWESSVSPFTTWNTISNTLTTYTSGALTQTTQFRAIVQNGTCPTDISAATTVTIDPTSVGGSISGGSTICSGSTSGLLTLSGNTGSVIRWESSVSPFTTWSTISNTSSTYTSGTLTQTTQFRAVVQSGTCSSANSSAVTVTVIPSSVGGNVSGGSTICTGSTSGTLTLSGNTGSIINWEYSVSPFTTWTTISNTSSTYTSGVLTQTTQFRAVVQNGSCSSASSSPTTVTVGPASVGGSVSGGTNVCTGSTSPLLTLSGNTGSILRWESSVSPFTTWTTISNTSATYTSGVLTQTTQFRAVVQSGTCSSANSSTTTVTVDPTSVGGSVSGGATVCSGSTSGTLTLSGNTGSILRWESSVNPFTTWTTITNTSSTYTSGVLTQTTQFRAVIQSGSCSSASSSPTTVTVDPTSVGGSVNGGSNVCSGSTSPLLTLTGNTGSVVRWESSVSPFTTWTTISSTSLTYTSGVLTQTTQFRAVVQSGSCSNANSSATTVTIDPTSVGGSVSGGASVCSGSNSGLLTLSGNTGTVVRWESSVSPFTTWTTISNTSSTYTSGALAQTTQFRAVVQSGSCSSANSSTTTVTVTAGSVGGSVSGGTTICSGSTSGTLMLLGSSGSVLYWLSSVSPFTTWTTISNLSASYISGVLTQTTQFRALVQNGSCNPDTSTATTVTVNPTSVGGSVSGGANICSGSTSGTLTLSGNTGSIVRWESSVSPFTTWTTISNTSSTYTSGALTQTTQFRAVVQSGSCSSANSSTTTVTIDPASVGGSVSGGSTICSSSTSGTLTLSGNTGSILRWESSVSPFTTWTTIANTSSTYSSGALTQTTQFRAVVQSGSCSSANSSATTVTVDPTSVGGSVSGGANICSGSTSGLLTLSGHTGTILRWESSVSPFTTWTTISNTSSTYTSGTLTQTTQFRAVLQSGSCSSANSSTTTVTVDPTSVGGSVSGGSTICSGSTSGTLTLSGNTGSILRWESSVSPFTTWTTISNTSLTYTSGTLTQTTQFRAVVQSGSCTSANSSTTTVTVTAGSVGGSVSGGTNICSGSTSGLLTLSGNTGSINSWEYSVSPFTTWTTISNTSSTYTSGTLTQTTQFRAVVQSGSCSSANSSTTTVTVDPTSVGGSVSGGANICSGSTSGTLTLSGNTGSIVRWESSVSPFTTWTTISNTSSTYTSGVLTQTTQFRAVVQSGSCSSANSSTTTVTVDPTSVGGSVSGGANICSGSTSGTLTLSGNTGSIVRWEYSVSPFTTWTSISNTSSTYTSGTLTQTTQFRAVLQSGSCSSANSSTTTVTVDPTSVGGSVSGGSTICSGSTSGTLTLSGNTGSIVRWESSVSPFTTWTTISNTTSTYTSGVLTQTTQFRAIVQSGSCSSANASSATVTVNTGGGSWLGATSSSWKNSANWCGGSLPTVSSDITINSGTPFSLVIDTNAVVNNFTVGSGASVSFSGSTYSLDIRAALTNNGTFTATNGTVIFGGSSAQTIPAITYSGLSINGGSNKTLAGNTTVNGVLTLTSGKVLLGSKNLTVSSTGSISGGTSSSYVVTDSSGKLIINNIGPLGNSGNVLYPIGSSATSYTPIWILNTGTTDNFDVNVLGLVSSSYLGNTATGTSLTSNVVGKTWFINEATAGGSTLMITTQWNGGDELTSFSRTNCGLANYNGTTWISGALSSASGTDPYIQLTSNITTLGAFAIGDNNSSVPVELLSFDAYRNGNDALLNWSTASELNNSHFDVERSIDGTKYTAIGKVKGNGTTNTVHSYQFTDNSLSTVNSELSTIYYRLKQVDFDGKYAYSKVASIRNNTKGKFEIVNVEPNPFNEQFNLNFISSLAAPVNIEVVDMLGKTISVQTMQPQNGLNTYHYSTESGMNAGVYFVRLTQGESTKIIKLIRQN
ncbi:MAG: T9SS type A sorting domain-containing protein [Bacteroidota bacterium]